MVVFVLQSKQFCDIFCTFRFPKQHEIKLYDTGKVGGENFANLINGDTLVIG